MAIAAQRFFTYALGASSSDRHQGAAFDWLDEQVDSLPLPPVTQ
jgi:hypothetical protein